MPAFAILQTLATLALVVLTALPLGRHMARVYEGRRTWLSWLVGPIEYGIYGLCRIQPAQEQNWRSYARSALVFNLCGILACYATLRLQAWLPFNPAGMAAVPADLAFNTAVSFSTNADWQAYGGENTLGYLSQMMALTVQNFTSAATGLAVLAAVIRGFSRRSAATVGNFYADTLRSILYVLLPLSLVFALVLVWQGVPQNLDAYATAVGLEGHGQILAQGPAASQTAIKMLGTNGGGFFGANSAHPYENPSALTNVLQIWAMLVIPVAAIFAFGRMVGDRRQSRALLLAMAIMLVAGIAMATHAERGPHPLVTASLHDAHAGNMEGKEARLGVAGSALFEVVTTATGTGAANSSLDSFTPAGGMVAMVNLMLKEVIFGGVGTGLAGMLTEVIITVFIAGLMVGRTPEYLGKRIEEREIKLAMLLTILFPLGTLGLGALSMMVPAGAAAITASGPHGLSQALYAYVSATANNGSAFGGFAANSVYPNTMLGLALLIGRFLMLVPTLALAGALAAKRRGVESAGTLPTHGGLFIGLLIAVVLVVGGLTFFPLLALGPIAEQAMMDGGATF